MAKRTSGAVESRRKKQRAHNDSLLLSGVFSKGSADVEDWENAEQDYELAPRSLDTKEVIEGLPIKRGKVVERVVREKEVQEEDEDNEEEEKVEEQPVEPESEVDEKIEEDNLTPQEKLAKIKEEIASLASQLMEDPEENISALTKLRVLAESEEFATSQLAILALVPVFKSLAPGYQIRPLTEVEQKERVSKEVAKLRNFEQGLVHNYRHYIDLLSKLARVLALNSSGNKKVTPFQIKQGHTATNAACELCLSSLRHFNFKLDLFTIPVRRLNKKPLDKSDVQLFYKCLRTLETLLKDDKDHGSITFDIVRIMTKTIKDKKFRVDESVINVFLSLSLLADYDPHGMKDTDNKVKTKKKDRVHLSKKEKKARKEMKAIDEEMRKAEQTITAEERERFQAQTLKLLLKFYLEILRAASTSVDEKSEASLLMAAVLEGLSRFGLMANFDLFGDFLEVLRETMFNIIEEHTLETDKYGVGEVSDSGGVYTKDEARKLLLSIVAAFALMVNHKEVGRLPISVDLSKFVSSLYTILADLSLDTDMEFSHKSLRLADPLDDSGFAFKPAVNVSTEAELLLKSLDFIFFRSRVGSQARAMPFIKRLYMSALQTPEKTTIALLKFVGKLLGKYGDGLKGLWSTEDTIGGEGDYVLGIEKEGFEVDYERSNVGSAVLWENVLLDKHYCPVIRDGSRSLMKSSKASNSR